MGLPKSISPCSPGDIMNTHPNIEKLTPYETCESLFGKLKWVPGQQKELMSFDSGHRINPSYNSYASCPHML